MFDLTVRTLLRGVEPDKAREVFATMVDRNGTHLSFLLLERCSISCFPIACFLALAHRHGFDLGAASNDGRSHIAVIHSLGLHPIHVGEILGILLQHNPTWRHDAKMDFSSIIPHHFLVAPLGLANKTVSPKPSSDGLCHIFQLPSEAIAEVLKNCSLQGTT